MFSMSGVDKRRFLEAVKADPQTYKDWEGNGEWTIETSGKEDMLFSPFLRKPFKKALDAGLLPSNLATISGTWGSVSDQGDLTYLNLIALPGYDGTDPADLTTAEMEGRYQATAAIAALKRFMPGCEDAKLRNFGMTLGVRDTRKIDARYNLTGADVRGEARFDDSIGIFPEFIDGYGILILPTTGRYFQLPYRALLPRGVDNLLVAGRCIGGDKTSHAAVRNMMCCAVGGQGAGVAAAVSLATNKPLDAVDIGLVAGRAETPGRSYSLIRPAPYGRGRGDFAQSRSMVGSDPAQRGDRRQLLRLRFYCAGGASAARAARLEPVRDRAAERGLRAAEHSALAGRRDIDRPARPRPRQPGRGSVLFRRRDSHGAQRALRDDGDGAVAVSGSARRRCSSRCSRASCSGFRPIARRSPWRCSSAWRGWGPYSADISPRWAAGIYAGGWQPPLVLAAALTGISLIAAIAYDRIDRHRVANAESAGPRHAFQWRDVAVFDVSFWYILGLNVLFASVFFPFRSTFAIEYFQDAKALSLADAGLVNSWVLFRRDLRDPRSSGLIADRFGRRAFLLTVGAALVPLTFAILGFTHWSLWISTAMMGVSFSPSFPRSSGRPPPCSSSRAVSERPSA